MGRPSTGRPLGGRIALPLGRELTVLLGRLFFRAVNKASRAIACWICRRRVDRRDDVLIALLLARLRFRHTAPGCPRQCEELRINSEVILARFYYLECRHYCARHIDHRCCVCRTPENPQTPRPPQAVNSK